MTCFEFERKEGGGRGGWEAGGLEGEKKRGKAAACLRGQVEGLEIDIVAAGRAEELVAVDVQRHGVACACGRRGGGRLSVRGGEVCACLHGEAALAMLPISMQFTLGAWLERLAIPAEQAALQGLAAHRAATRRAGFAVLGTRGRGR